MAANDDAGKLKGILGDIQNEMDGIKSVFDQSTSSLKSMVGAAQQFQNHQKGITKLSNHNNYFGKMKNTEEKQNLSPKKEPN